MGSLPIADGITHRETTFGGVPTSELVYEPTDPDTVIYFHGGGYRMGSAAAFAGYCSHLAATAGIRVIAVDYRLAPEAPFPAAFDDALAVYRAVIDTYAGRIFVAGDSAGGGLGAALLLEAARRGWRPPAGGILLSPWLDMTITAPSFSDCAATDGLWSATAAFDAAQMYLGGTDPGDDRVSPLFGDWRGQPPLLIQASGAEVLRDDSRRLAARAREAGVDVEHLEMPGQAHVWHYGFGSNPAADEAFASISGFISGIRRRPHVSQESSTPA